MSRVIPAALTFAWAIAVTPGCGEHAELVIGGNPRGDLGGGPGVGGAVAAGGAAGVFPAGGASIDTANGGSAAIGGSAPYGGTAGVGAETFDPYPPVQWAEGEGYRLFCPPYDDFWGFTCWNYGSSSSSSACRDSGDPYCNACLCSVPCEVNADCPRTLTGGRAACITTEDTTKACFPVCDASGCPDGMTCMPYPGAARAVCMWVHGPFG